MEKTIARSIDDSEATRRKTGSINLGSFAHLEPVSRSFGLDRGTCIDRHYIERFLQNHAGDIHGRVLEVADRAYTTRFGGARVARSDVLHATAENPKATLVADLTRPEKFPSEAFDCVVLTQTLQHVYDVRAAVGTLFATLKPGGVALVTVPGISQISRYDMERWGDFWRFTTLSAQRLFSEVFAPSRIAVKAHGNVLTAVAFLQGMVVEDLSPDALDYDDRDYEVLITVRAQR